MFTGIVKGIGTIVEATQKNGILRLGVTADPGYAKGLERGASVSIGGVCLTVVDFDEATMWFDVIGETLKRTTVGALRKGSKVNIERSAKIGDEIGGHLLSGHIYGTAQIDSVERQGDNCEVGFCCPTEWTKYLFPKGYVALDGASLTLVDVDKSKGRFTVHLIPETLQRTTFGSKKTGDSVNVELDSQTQSIVDTVERLYASRSTS